MTIKLAKHAGFCYGVKRAVTAVEDALGKSPVATLGPIIHNPFVVDRLSKLGVRVLSDPEKAAEGELVILRSHGVSPDVFDNLRRRGAQVLDMACPHVAKIHRIVESRGNSSIIIVGESEHPEVRAIAARSGEQVYVVSNADEAKDLPPLENAIAVAQTTLKRTIWDEVLAVLRNKITHLTAHETICRATHDRQTEAEALSKEADAMLIIGGPNSSNTCKLYEICAQNCPSWLIQDSSELPAQELRAFSLIGITAGASTPDEIIKEVITVMNELDKNVTPESETLQPEAMENINPEVSPVQEASAVAEANEQAAAGGNSVGEEAQEPQESDGKDSNFMTEFEKTLVSIRPGQFVTGTVVQITDDEVCVNIGYKSDGIVPRAELTSDESPKAQFKVGDEIDVEVVKVNDGEGNVLLSQKNFIVMKNWDALVEKFQNGEYVDGVGKNVVKGGLICDVQGVRTFVPASQLAERYVEKIEQFIGEPMQLKIIEVDKPKRRFVASRKQVLAEEGKKARELLWEKLEEGAVVHGIVRRLTDFGAFVDIGGMDGLVHVTDLSWGRVRHPGDVVKPNDEIDVQVLSIDRERNRISLGYKQLQPRPWDNATVNYPAGSIVEGKVVRMVTFGAFVELEAGLDGLVHISQIANQRVNKVEDVLTIGQMVNVKILDVNPEAKRISLSIREALGAEDQLDDLDALPSDPTDVVLAHSTESAPEIEIEEPAVPIEEAPTEETPAEEAPAEDVPAEPEA